MSLLRSLASTFRAARSDHDAETDWRGRVAALPCGSPATPEYDTMTLPLDLVLKAAAEADTVREGDSSRARASG